MGNDARIRPLRSWPSLWRGQQPPRAGRPIACFCAREVIAGPAFCIFPQLRPVFSRRFFPTPNYRGRLRGNARAPATNAGLAGSGLARRETRGPYCFAPPAIRKRPCQEPCPDVSFSSGRAKWPSQAKPRAAGAGRQDACSTLPAYARPAAPEPKAVLRPARGALSPSPGPRFFARGPRSAARPRAPTCGPSRRAAPRSKKIGGASIFLSPRLLFREFFDLAECGNRSLLSPFPPDCRRLDRVFLWAKKTGLESTGAGREASLVFMTLAPARVPNPAFAALDRFAHV